MNEEVYKLAEQLRSLIGESRKITDTTSIHDVFIAAEGIIGLLAYLISPLALLEQRYHQKVVEFIDVGDSTSKATAKAKATDEYLEWRKFQALYDLGHEQVMLLKKFKDKLTDEFNRA